MTYDIVGGKNPGGYTDQKKFNGAADWEPGQQQIRWQLPNAAEPLKLILTGKLQENERQWEKL